MATSKTAITTGNIHSWLASLGYLFPSTEGELARFERLYADVVIPEGELLDPEVILGNKPRRSDSQIEKPGKKDSIETLRMAARNGKGEIPDHILQRMKKNHKKPGNTNDGSEEKSSD